MLEVHHMLLAVHAVLNLVLPRCQHDAACLGAAGD